MGRNEVEPAAGGTARMVLDGFAMAATVTVWEPPARVGVRHHRFSPVPDPAGAGKTWEAWLGTLYP